MGQIHYRCDYIDDDTYTVTVAAVVQNGRSSGPFLREITYENVREHHAVARFLADLTAGGCEIHPDDDHVDFGNPFTGGIDR